MFPPNETNWQWGGTTPLHFICNSSLTIILPLEATWTQKIRKHRHVNSEHTTTHISLFRLGDYLWRKSSTPTNLSVKWVSNMAPRMQDVSNLNLETRSRGFLGFSSVCSFLLHRCLDSTSKSRFIFSFHTTFCHSLLQVCHGSDG